LIAEVAMPGVSFQSRLLAVGHPAVAASAGSAPPAWFGPPFDPSDARAVFHPDKPQSLSDVRRADARSAHICRPNGVARCFHVSANKVEPTEAVLARNLFSKDNWRAALLDKSVELWPKVAFIGEPSSFSCGAKRLAGAGAGPDSAVVWPACEAKGQPPSPDTGEEMALIVADEVFRIHFANASLINVPVRYVSCRYQVS